MQPTLDLPRAERVGPKGRLVPTIEDTAAVAHGECSGVA